MRAFKVGGVTFIQAFGLQVSYCVLRKTRHQFQRNVRRVVLGVAAACTAATGIMLGDIVHDYALAADRHELVLIADGLMWTVDRDMSAAECAEWTAAPGYACYLASPLHMR